MANIVNKKDGTQKMKQKMNEFSVALGLFDYINPIFYAITSITIIKNYYGVMSITSFIFLAAGCILSMIFGLSIPTLKFIVGLGKIKFKMPVNLVFYVNLGLFITGMTLFKYTFLTSTITTVLILLATIILLLMIYLKSKKFNTIAVLIGMVGYLLIYSSLIKTAIKSNYYLSIILYSIAICFMIFLVLIGVFSNLKKAKVHWTLEICNVLCQGFVALSTVLLFAHI